MWESRPPHKTKIAVAATNKEISEIDSFVRRGWGSEVPVLHSGLVILCSCDRGECEHLGTVGPGRCTREAIPRRFCQDFTKWLRIPYDRIRGGISEHLDEESRKDAVGFGIGFGAKTAETMCLIEDLDDTMLFRKGWERNFVRLESVNDHAGHFRTGDVLRGICEKLW